MRFGHGILPSEENNLSTYRLIHHEIYPEPGGGGPRVVKGIQDGALLAGNDSSEASITMSLVGSDLPDKCF